MEPVYLVWLCIHCPRWVGPIRSQRSCTPDFLRLGCWQSAGLDGCSSSSQYTPCLLPPGKQDLCNVNINKDFQGDQIWAKYEFSLIWWRHVSLRLVESLIKRCRIVFGVSPERTCPPDLAASELVLLRPSGIQANFLKTGKKERKQMKRMDCAVSAAPTQLGFGSKLKQHVVVNVTSILGFLPHVTLGSDIYLLVITVVTEDLSVSELNLSS